MSIRKIASHQNFVYLFPNELNESSIAHSVRNILYFDHDGPDELKISTVIHWRWWNLRPRFQTDRSVHRELKLRVAGPSGAIITVRKRRYEAIIVKGTRNTRAASWQATHHLYHLNIGDEQLGCRATISSTRFYPAVPLLEARSTTFNRDFSSDCTASRIVKFIFPNFYIRLFSFLDIICVEM